MGKAPEYNGFITNLVNIHSGDLWYLDRRFVVRSTAAHAWQHLSPTGDMQQHDISCVAGLVTSCDMT